VDDRKYSRFGEIEEVEPIESPCPEARVNGTGKLMVQAQTNGQTSHIDSFYAHRLAPRRLYPPLKGSTEVDVAVIGGGLAGLTATRELARRGHSVALVEAERVGWGASGRNGGFVAPGFSENLFSIEKHLGHDAARRLYSLSVQGMAHVEQVILQAGRQDIIGGRGWMHVVRHDRVDRLQRWRDRMLRDYGVEMRFVGRDDIQEYLKTAQYHGGLVDPRPFHIDPLAYAELLAGDSAAAGARIFEQSRVLRLTEEGDRHVLNTADGRLCANQIVLATSAYGGPLRAMENSILPVATYVIASEPADAALGEAITYGGCIADTRRAGDYYRVVDDAQGKRLLWGGRITTRRSEPGNLATLLLADIRQIYPQLSDLRVAFSWSGLMGYARHKMPVIRAYKPGLFVLTGFGGHGLNTTAMGGVVIADAVCGQHENLNLFSNYGLVWGGGSLGRVATQMEYLRLKLLDRFEEW
jgi:glycine/D-amino acid oxidase-like deaminating enzyme